jgi:hypothetical protein
MLLFIYLNELVNSCTCNRIFLEQNSIHKYVLITLSKRITPISRMVKISLGTRNFFPLIPSCMIFMRFLCSKEGLKCQGFVYE